VLEASLSGRTGLERRFHRIRRAAPHTSVTVRSEPANLTVDAFLSKAARACLIAAMRALLA
jgi:hypothetical protein